MGKFLSLSLSFCELWEKRFLFVCTNLGLKVGGITTHLNESGSCTAAQNSCSKPKEKTQKKLKI
jgi:hypothetical protein